MFMFEKGRRGLLFVLLSIPFQSGSLLHLKEGISSKPIFYLQKSGYYLQQTPLLRCFPESLLLLLKFHPDFPDRSDSLTT